MEQAERDNYIDTAVEAAGLQIRDHAAKLHALETGRGFDLDVVTDIYGLSLLDPTVASQEIITRWQSLFDALNTENSVILLCQLKKELVPGCYGFGAQAKYQYPIRSTLVRTTDTTRVVYNGGSSQDGDTAVPHIILQGVQSTTVEPGAHHEEIEWTNHPVLLAQPYETKFRLGDATAVSFNTGPLGIGSDHTLIRSISQRVDLIEAGNQLANYGARFSHFALRPFEELLDLMPSTNVS